MKPCSETLLTFHFPEAMQHSFVLKFHTHPLEQHQLPIEVKPSSPSKKVNRISISPILRGHRTQAARGSSLVKCFPCAPGFSQSNPHVTRMSSVCNSYILVCHPYVTRMYSYITRMSFICHSYMILMSLVCTRMSFVCHSYVLVYHSYVTRLWFYHEPKIYSHKHFTE